MKLKRKIIYTLLLASFTASAIASPWPQSEADFAKTTNQTPITISVLANDTGDSLTVVESNDWTQNGGRTSISKDTIQYTPPKDFIGTDAFWYVMEDSEGRTNSAKVSIEVTEATASAWPVGATDTRKITNDRESIRIAVLANDTGDNLTITETNKWTKKGGRTRIRGNKIKYWPPADFVGLDTFWYVLTDAQGRTNSAKVRVRISEAAEVEKSVVAFCGGTYETDGTAAGTSLSLLSPELPTTLPELPEAVEGVITVDGRTYSIDDSVSPTVLTMTNDAGSTSNIVTASSDTSIEIVGGHTSTSKVFFAVGKKLYSHDGSSLTTIAEDYTELLPSSLPVTGYLTNGFPVRTAIGGAESATDDFYFYVSASLSSGPSGSITLRIDNTSGKAVEAGISFGEPNGRIFSATTEDKFYYFNGLDYSQNRNYSTGGTNSRSIIQRSNGEISNTFADVNVETYAVDRDRLFIITEEVDAILDGLNEAPRIPSKLLVIDGNNEFVELKTCDAIPTPSPQPVADSAETTQNTDAVIFVLSNDAGDELTIKEVNSWTTSGGRAFVDGSIIRYRPPTDFIGTDSFWYVMQDKYGRTNSAEVTVTVTE